MFVTTGQLHSARGNLLFFYMMLGAFLSIRFLLLWLSDIIHKILGLRNCA